jgi:hypothetical protein
MFELRSIRCASAVLVACTLVACAARVLETAGTAALPDDQVAILIPDSVGVHSIDGVGRKVGLISSIRLQPGLRGIRFTFSGAFHEYEPYDSHYTYQAGRVYRTRVVQSANAWTVEIVDVTAEAR